MASAYPMGYQASSKHSICQVPQVHSFYKLGVNPLCCIIESTQKFSSSRDCLFILANSISELGFEFMTIQCDSYLAQMNHMEEIANCTFLFAIVLSTDCSFNNYYTSSIQSWMNLFESHLKTEVPMIMIVDAKTSFGLGQQADIKREHSALIFSYDLSFYLTGLAAKILQASANKTFYDLHMKVAEEYFMHTANHLDASSIPAIELRSTMNKNVALGLSDFWIHGLPTSPQITDYHRVGPNPFALLFWTESAGKRSSEELQKKLKFIGFNTVINSFCTYNCLLKIIESNQNQIMGSSIFFLTIVCHGTSGNVCGSNSNCGSINGLIGKCNALMRKDVPLILVIDTCQVIRDSTRINLVRKNTALLMSTVLGGVSYSDSYMPALAMEIMKTNRNLSLYDLHTQATNKMIIKRGLIQTPEFRSTLTKKVLMLA
ncbi:uncharacterized protein [Watersipora subatra]|uniref:uncharacterized protein n=1 Tax=Watersipora subatra TaxID=2589382 RepID=UPI00355C7F81